MPVCKFLWFILAVLIAVEPSYENRVNMHRSLMKYFFKRIEDNDKSEYFAGYSCKAPASGRCCSCDVDCERRRDCCLDYNYWRTTLPVDQYVNDVIANQKYEESQCIPIVHLSGEQQRHSIEFVVMKNKCTNKNSPYYADCNENVEKKSNKRQYAVQSTETGELYDSAACAKCHGAKGCKAVNITISGCLNHHILDDVASNKTEIDLRKIRKCVIKPAAKTKHACPFEAYRFSKTSNLKCGTWDFQLCHSYLSLVFDETGRSWANPNCLMCTGTTFGGSHRNCSSLYDAEARKALVPVEKYSLTLSQFAQSAILNFENGSNTVLNVCQQDRGFDIYSGHCVSLTCNKDEIHVRSNCTERNPKEIRKDFQLVLLARKILCTVLILFSMLLLLLIVITYSYVKILFNTFGKILVCISVLMLIYYILLFTMMYVSLVHNIQRIFAIVMHWAMLCKYVWSSILVLDLYRNLPPSKKSSQERMFEFAFYNVALWIFTFLFVFICTGKDNLGNEHAVRYGYSGIFFYGNFTGWILWIFVPVLILSVVNLSSLAIIRCSIRYKEKQRNLFKVEKCEEKKYVQLLSSLCGVFLISDMAGLLYSISPFVEAELSGRLYELLYSALQSSQGIFVFVIFMRRHSLIFLCRWWITNKCSKREKNTLHKILYTRENGSGRCKVYISNVVSYVPDLDQLSIAESERFTPYDVDIDRTKHKNTAAKHVTPKKV